MQPRSTRKVNEGQTKLKVQEDSSAFNPSITTNSFGPKLALVLAGCAIVACVLLNCVWLGALSSYDVASTSKYFKIFDFSKSSLSKPHLIHFSCDEVQRWKHAVDDVEKKSALDFKSVYDAAVSQSHHACSPQDSQLLFATRDICQQPNGKGKNLLRAVVDPSFIENYARVFYGIELQTDGEKSSFILNHNSATKCRPWIEEAYVNYFSDEGTSTGRKHYNRTSLLIQSVHKLSTRPIIVFHISASTNVTVSNSSPFPKLKKPKAFLSHSLHIAADLYPRLVVIHLAAQDSQEQVPRIGFDWNKFRSMLLSKVRVGLEVDSDSLIYSTADKIFERTRKNFLHSFEAPFPVSPVHWMSRDADSDDFRYEPSWIFLNSDEKRTMRWVHAHPTWTYLALPFIGTLYGGIIKRDEEFRKLLRDNFVCDETALNVYYWNRGINMQWCKYDIFPNAFKAFFEQDVDAMLSCCNLNDIKWYPFGIVISFLTTHAIKNDNEATTLLQAMEVNSKRHIPFLFFRGKFYSDFDKVPKEGRSCYL